MKKRSYWGDVWGRLKKNRPAMLGLVILSIICLLLLAADLIIPYENAIRGVATERLQGPSLKHFFGTDNQGRDIFGRVLHGGRMSMMIGVLAVVCSITIGSLLGAAVGYYGGKFDNVLMRLLDVITCIPATLLTMAIVTALGPGMVNLMIALVIGDLPGVVRLVRSTVINLTGMEYIEAASAFGSSGLRIVSRHLIPNAMGTIIVQATGMIAGTIIAAAGLSFLGFGVQPPDPEWGVMLSDARSYLRDAPYMMLFPGLSIMLAALAIMLLGDGLRDALDPRLKD